MPCQWLISGLFSPLFSLFLQGSNNLCLDLTVLNLCMGAYSKTTMAKWIFRRSAKVSLQVMLFALSVMASCLRSFATQDTVPAIPVIQASDTMLCEPAETTVLTVANPDSIDLFEQRVGPQNLSIGSFSSFTGILWYTNFTVLSPTVKILTIDMFFSGGGSTYTLIIRRSSDQQTVFTKSGTVTVTSSVTPQVIALNATLAAGNYQIGLTVNPGCYRNSTGAVYPYQTSLPGVSITGNTFSDQSNYYFFYNWLVEVPVPSPTIYTWSPGNQTGTSITVSPDSNVTYAVLATKQNGTTSSAQKSIYYGHVNPPVITPSGATTFCLGGTVPLNATTGYATYSWSNGSTTVGSTASIVASPSTSSLYTVTVTGGGECTSSATIPITVDILPPPEIMPGDTNLCEGESVVLDAGTGYASYAWSDGQGSLGNSQSIMVSTSGAYTVLVTDGCSSSATANVIVHPTPPPFSIDASESTTLCINGSDPYVILRADTPGAGAGGLILWNDLFGGSGPEFVVYPDDINLQLGGNAYAYSAIVVNPYGCTNSSNQISVTAQNCPTTLGLKLFLEGYYLGGGIMHSVLANQVVSNATGFETDTIWVELRSIQNPAVPVARRRAMLMIDGNATTAFPVPAGNYWIVVTHRNSLQTWSTAPVSLPAGLFDFSATASNAYASNQIDLFNEGIWSFFTGDLNQDEFIDIFDFPYYDEDNSNFVSFKYVKTDMNGDGFVDIFDFPVYDINNFSFVFSMHP